MPIHKTKNEDFFKTWTGDMAYVLGFFTADGSMYRTKRNTCFIEFQITDRTILVAIQKALGSNHKITNRRTRNDHRKAIYRLQIGSKAIFESLEDLGFMQNKSKVIRLPEIPAKHFFDFLRGYFDGDGNVMFGYYKKPGRNYSSKYFATRFTSGSNLFLEDIKSVLADMDINGSLYYSSGGWRLSYGAHATKQLFSSMYHDNHVNDLIYLERKYKIFQRATNAVVAQFG